MLFESDHEREREIERNRENIRERGGEEKERGGREEFSFLKISKKLYKIQKIK